MPVSLASQQRRPVRQNLLSGDLNDLSHIHLLGSRCSVCNETSLGVSDLCQNCGSDKLTTLELASEGKLWTFTVVRHKPPGDYRGPDPFVPFGVGLVELPEGIRVMSPIAGEIDDMKIGQVVNFRAVVLADELGFDCIAFEFVPASRL